MKISLDLDRGWIKIFLSKTQCSAFLPSLWQLSWASGDSLYHYKYLRCSVLREEKQLLVSGRKAQSCWPQGSACGSPGHEIATRLLEADSALLRVPAALAKSQAVLQSSFSLNRNLDSIFLKQTMITLENIRLLR